jgi:hypothetical protein
MSSASATFRPAPGMSGLFKAFANEAYAFMQAVVSPNAIVSDVEQWRAMSLEAAQIESVDPARAAQLRRRANRIGSL